MINYNVSGFFCASTGPDAGRRLLYRGANVSLSSFISLPALFRLTALICCFSSYMLRRTKHRDENILF
jgi:hypothetical protein